MSIDINLPPYTIVCKPNLIFDKKGMMFFLYTSLVTVVWGFIILDFGVGSRLLTYTRIYPVAGSSVSDFSYRVAPQDFFLSKTVIMLGLTCIPGMYSVFLLEDSTFKSLRISA